MGNFSRGGDNNRDSGRRTFGGGFRDRGGFNRGGRGDKQMYQVVCSKCGKDCRVPFRPTGDKPVYCSDCFEKVGDRGGRNYSDRRNFNDRSNRGDQFGVQFEAVNAKLDKILNMLQPKEIQEVVLPAKSPAVKVQTKTLKVKKSSKKENSSEKNKA